MAKSTVPDVGRNYEWAQTVREMMLAVPLADWRAIKRMVCRCKPRKAPRHELVISVAAGAAVSAFLSGLGLQTATAPAWLHAVTWAACIAGTVIAVVVHVMSRDHEADRTERVESVLEQMEHVESRFNLPEGAVAIDGLVEAHGSQKSLPRADRSD
ncbi:MAG TPA: hypothetical protein VN719_09455 [Gemmatimonadales bacterium]|nr:hypothetical protein [Gemmatimonadales bacterium]